jgi:arylsulfatase A-like enzyme
MAVPNADTLDAATYEAVRACGGVFGTPDYGSCPGELQMRAMTNSLDTVLGKLLDVVDALDPNTYVILIGDNGTPMYGRPNLDFIDNMYITRSGRGKGTVYESGARVPMVIRGPGVEAGSESRVIAHAVDVYATALELAGLEVPQAVSNSEGTGTLPLAGMSLAPIAFGDATTLRDPNEGFVLTETHDLMRGGVREVGARNGSHKVLCRNGASVESCEFYDLVQDPLEEYPLARPDSCADYANGRWSPSNADWHFCRLIEVVATKSFL